jgi:hypothetical protein
LVAERPADVTHAPGDRFIGHTHTRPDRLKQCVLGHEPARALDEATEHIEALGAQLNVALGGT